jgi:hypothetical protein
MIERRELITICRQIGNMMEAGVDILRVTQVLRAQTDNPRLLQIYNQFDHDLRMGASIAEAMARASDLFSPFMVSLVRQAEQRSDLESVSAYVAAAFLKIAEFIQQDEEEAREASAQSVGVQPVVEAVISTPLDIRAVADSPNTWPLTLRAIESFTDRLQLIALRALTLLAGLLLSLAAVWYSVEMQWIERQWQNVVLCSVAALFIACAGVWVRRQIGKEKRQTNQCSFCGQGDSEEAPLRPIPGFPGAAICAPCAIAFASMAQPHNGQADGAASPTLPNVIANPTVPATSGTTSPESAKKDGAVELQDESGILNGKTKGSGATPRLPPLHTPRSTKRSGEGSRRGAEQNTPKYEEIDEADYE